jgi:acetyl esterase/lipase
MKRSLRILAVGLVVLLSFATCRKIEEPSYLVAAQAETLLDVSYGSDELQTMDIYLPAYRTTNTNVVIFVHGGSFIGGDKSEFTAQAKYMAARGYAVFNVNYRLVEGSGIFDTPPSHLVSPIKVKDQIDDMSAIVDFVIERSRALAVSDTKIGFAGHSAGATLALLYSYSARNQDKVKVVANIAGALDMVFTNIPNWQTYPPFTFEAGYRYTGYPIEAKNEQFFKDISPFYQINAGHKVPTLNIFPQNNDVLGLPKQDYATYNAFTVKLDELKIPNEFFFVAETDHYFSQAGDWPLVLNKTITYFNSILK